MLLHCLPSRSSSRIGQMQHCDNKGVDSPLKGYRRRLGDHSSHLFAVISHLSGYFQGPYLNFQLDFGELNIFL